MSIAVSKIKARNWVIGTMKCSEGEFQFEAKIFCEPSEWGIFNGRVSKLWVADMNRKCIFNFSRGWDLGDKEMASHGKIKELIEFLENFAQSKEFNEKQAELGALG